MKNQTSFAEFNPAELNSFDLSQELFIQWILLLMKLIHDSF